MVYAYLPNALWAWAAFLLLFFRFLGIRAVAFAAVLPRVWMAAVHIQMDLNFQATTSKGVPCTPGSKKGRQKSARSGDVASNGEAEAESGLASDPLRNARSLNTTPIPRCPRPSFTPHPAKSSAPQLRSQHQRQHLPSIPSMASVYEDIMSADAETIRVQQATIHSQQELLGTQRDMIEKLRHLVEAQDAWIDGFLGGEDEGS
ncbi:hypothetical protein BDV95DRAFT_316426 [Massariosphaeria phaeospora]|uniref:Uncharacterized protein n=1 Tax=Massariosphaeria phaeospora TaxID=100035 RepID=A0A7C8IDQ5_9PLEO|nr:hypothetical protein BDV95DRAFT_316426 [Massariosphaeria phaeospora]